MALGSEMDDTVNLLVLHQLIESIEVADVHLDKLIIGLVLDVLEVGEVTSVCKFVQVDDVILRVFVHEEANDMRANKSGTACNNYISFHNNLSKGKRPRAKGQGPRAEGHGQKAKDQSLKEFSYRLFAVV